LHRRAEREVAPYLYAGVQLVTPSLFSASPNEPFSMNLLWDEALAAGRCNAIVHDGVWFHLSTPQDLARAQALLDARAVGNTT
jgi:MurNAc alpha-1-phosphate uridylyltransferase